MKTRIAAFLAAITSTVTGVPAYAGQTGAAPSTQMPAACVTDANCGSTEAFCYQGYCYQRVQPAEQAQSARAASTSTPAQPAQVAPPAQPVPAPAPATPVSVKSSPQERLAKPGHAPAAAPPRVAADQTARPVTEPNAPPPDADATPATYSPVRPSATSAAPVTSTPAPAPASALASDTGLSAQRLGIGFFGFGFAEVPIAEMDESGGGLLSSSVRAPAIGLRYWTGWSVGSVLKNIGFEAGVGVNTTGGSRISEAPQVTTTEVRPTYVSTLLYGGVPLTVAAGQHYAVNVTPEVIYGFSDATMLVQDQAPVLLKGTRLDLGARFAYEQTFGFVGVPNLSLEASVRMGFVQEGTSRFQEGVAAVTNTKWSFSTSLNDDLGAVLGSIGVRYYFR